MWILHVQPLFCLVEKFFENASLLIQEFGIRTDKSAFPVPKRLWQPKIEKSASRWIEFLGKTPQLFAGLANIGVANVMTA